MKILRTRPCANGRCPPTPEWQLSGELQALPRRLSIRAHNRGVCVLEVAFCDIKLGRSPQTPARFHRARRDPGRNHPQQPSRGRAERLRRPCFFEATRGAPVPTDSSLGASNSLSHAWIASSRSMTKPSPRSSRQSANSCGHETRRAAASVSPPSWPTIGRAATQSIARSFSRNLYLQRESRTVRFLVAT